MSKLREKFKKATSQWFDTTECEQIADDFAVKFQNFISSRCQRTEWIRVYKFNGLSYTTTELLQIFKSKYYE